MNNKKSFLVALIFGILTLSSIFVAAHSIDSNQNNYGFGWMDRMHDSMQEYFVNGNFDHEAMHKEMIQSVPEEEREYHETMHESMHGDGQKGVYEGMSCHGG